MTDRPRTLLIACGAIAREVLTMIEENGWDHMRVECLPADLHNTPDEIAESVRRKIHESRPDFDSMLVLYADCGTGGGLDRVLEEEGVERIGGAHCYEIFTGPAAFADLMKEEPGSFFVTDFLARHFDRLVYQGLGLDRFPQLLAVYFDKYKRVVYLAQREDPALEAMARQAAEKLELDFEMRFTGHGGYQDFLAQRTDCPTNPDAN